MGQSISNAHRSEEVRLQDVVRPTAAKASLRSDRLVGLPFVQVTTDAVLRYYGSVKATAYALGECDPSLMQREFQAGKFGRFDEHADLNAKAYVAKQLAEAFADLGSREARILQLKRTIADSIEEMALLAVSA